MTQHVSWFSYITSFIYGKIRIIAQKLKSSKNSIPYKCALRSLLFHIELGIYRFQVVHSVGRLVFLIDNSYAEITNCSIVTVQFTTHTYCVYGIFQYILKYKSNIYMAGFDSLMLHTYFRLFCFLLYKSDFYFYLYGSFSIYGGNLKKILNLIH